MNATCFVFTRAVTTGLVNVSVRVDVFAEGVHTKKSVYSGTFKIYEKICKNIYIVMLFIALQ